MPLAWGDTVYYLSGSFNSWAINNDYVFTASSGTYTLTTDIPANAEFKIVKVVDGDTQHAKWYGTYGNQGTFEFYRGHNTYGETHEGGNDDKFVLPGVATGSATFTFTLNNDGKPINLVVTRVPQLYIRGFGDWNTNEAMTQTSTGGWTISKNLSHTDNAEDSKFNFKDEYGTQHGWNGDNDYTVNSGLLGTSIPIAAGVKVFYMDATVPDGNYIIEVNSAIDHMFINQVESKSLAQIQSSGVVGKFYTVNEDLQLVYVNPTKHLAWARDLGNSTVTSPAETATGTASDPIDYMRYGKIRDNAQAGPWQQNNWVMLDFTGTSWLDDVTVGEAINANTFKGIYTDNNNYTIKVHPTAQITFNTNHSQYTPNVYCPANFHSSNTQQGADGKYYWFNTPKPMEVFELTWALWYDGSHTYPGENGELGDGDDVTVNYPAGFYMQHGESGLKGGIGADMSYNSTAVTLTSGASYQFLTVAMNGPSKGDPLRAGSTIPADPTKMYPELGSSTQNSNFQIAPVNLTATGDQVITGVSEVKTGSEVVSVTYCDLAGRMSQKPFAGVNIIVTRYSDGTVKTTKAIR